MPLTASQTTVREKPPPRKRNVVSRGRTGCLTCRRRRLKCDETKPGCNNCRRVNLPCEGYAQKITFKDQTNLVVERAQGKPTRRKSQPTTALAKEEAVTADISTSGISSPGPDSSPSEALKNPSSASSKSSGSADSQGYDISPRHIKGERPNLDDQGVSLPFIASDYSPKTEGHRLSLGSNDAHFSSTPYQATFPSSRDSNIAIDQGYMTPCSPVSTDFIPSPGNVLPNSFLCLAGAFEFPEDYTYFEFSTGDKFLSLSKVLPLSELFKSEPVSPHVYNAAFALAALTLSTFEHRSRGSFPLRRHAFHHSLKAVQGLQDELCHSTHSATSSGSPSPETAISLFATIMLLANFELQRGCLLSWRSHMRGAASCLSAGYKSIIKKSAGMLLIRAFARMALLLRLYNEDYSVTTPDCMPTKLANWLNLLLRQSSHLQDRILLMVEEITKLEIQKRQQPTLDEFWLRRSAKLLERLEEWRQDLPASEVPVEDTSSGAAYLTVSSSTHSSLIRVNALCFPNSVDPCASAVNYAAYLCTGMRARTRYLPDVGRVLPPGGEQTALTICRIAAGIPPARFGESFTYSYGMLPSVVGAYRWSTNPGLRSWVKHWLAGYNGTREGIWHVGQTLRLLEVMDRQYASQDSSSGWEFVSVRVVDEPTDPSPELEEAASSQPFKIVLHSRNRGGASANVVVVE